MEMAEQFASLDRELIFIVMEGREGAKIAFESNFGIVAFGEDIEELKYQINAQVAQFFNGEYGGKIFMRQFYDTVLTDN